MSMLLCRTAVLGSRDYARSSQGGKPGQDRSRPTELSVLPAETTETSPGAPPGGAALLLAGQRPAPDRLGIGAGFEAGLSGSDCPRATTSSAEWTIQTFLSDRPLRAGGIAPPEGSGIALVLRLHMVYLGLPGTCDPASFAGRRNDDQPMRAR